ncbi:hypothetical protein BHYA_0001g00420 [Botrytis hyacinthi]|uniref:Uncharacterized protein n=1 Tax=Botrytis hyacinthi TaxID=278943 RepID=A0A4Z1HE84_9HELO|nr:hypothetical protein BHYA_0001g00420 [Botrytis hyacinthi]
MPASRSKDPAKSTHSYSLAAREIPNVKGERGLGGQRIVRKLDELVCKYDSKLTLVTNARDCDQLRLMGSKDVYIDKEEMKKIGKDAVGGNKDYSLKLDVGTNGLYFFEWIDIPTKRQKQSRG